MSHDSFIRDVVIGAIFVILVSTCTEKCTHTQYCITCIESWLVYTWCSLRSNSCKYMYWQMHAHAVLHHMYRFMTRLYLMQSQEQLVSGNVLTNARTRSTASSNAAFGGTSVAVSGVGIALGGASVAFATASVYEVTCECVIHEYLQVRTCTLQHTYQRYYSSNTSWLLRLHLCVWKWNSSRVKEWFDTNKWMSAHARMRGVTYKWVTSRMNESCHTFTRLRTHILLRGCLGPSMLHRMCVCVCVCACVCVFA